MNDLISRQAAIDALIRKSQPVDNGDGTMTITMMTNRVIKETLEKLPSAQPKQQWIPCSERLPDIKEHYVSEPCIVYCDNGAYGFAELEENIFGQVGWDCERDDEYHEPLGEVLAWMPLPEAWKGE